MPTIWRVLYMQAAIIGAVLGLLAMSLPAQLPPLGLLAALPPLLLLSLRYGGTGGGVACGLLLGGALALAHGYSREAMRLPSQCETGGLVVVGVVSSLPRATRMNSGELRRRFEFALESTTPSACSGPERLLLSWYDGPEPEPGQRWRLQVALKRPWGLANPGSFNMQAWYARTAIDALGTVRGRGTLLSGNERSLRYAHHALRQRVARRLRELPFDGQVRAVLLALSVADRSGLDHHLWSLLQQFGLNHLVVVSGLHVGMAAGLGLILGSLLQRLCWLAGVPAGSGQLRLLSAAACALGYAALAGFSLSTLRALCMLFCFLLATAFGRRSGSLRNLLLAALALLACNPLAGLGSGFWLSFGSVAWLLWLGAARPGRGWLARLGTTHLYMTLAMLPMGAWWFGGSSRFSAVANLFMVPLVGLWVVPLSLAATTLSLLGLSLDRILWGLAATPVALLLPPARELARRHGDLLYLQAAPDWPALVLALAGVVLFALRAGVRAKLLAALLLLPLLLPPLDVAGGQPGALRVTVLDVGQGTAVLLRSGDRTLLYDTGGGDPAGSNMARSVILPYLRREGVGQLDHMVLSHPDADHSAGAESVLRALPVSQVLYSAGPAPVATARHCRAGMAWRWPGGVKLQILSPAREPDLSSNDGSCVLRVEFAGRSLLLPGDIGSGRERELASYWGPVLASEWLLAAHHGSKTSSSHTWLKWVRPGTVVFTHGYRNRFGHPHPEIYRRFEEAGAVPLDTASGGALEFVFLPDTVQLRRQRDGAQRFWM